MNWLKDVIVDIISTLLVIAAVSLNYPLLNGFLWGYTGLLLFAKILVVVSGGFLNMANKAKTNAPDWFSHLLYAVNTGLLFYFQWWYTASGWLLIWILSYIANRRINQS